MRVHELQCQGQAIHKTHCTSRICFTSREKFVRKLALKASRRDDISSTTAAPGAAVSLSVLPQQSIALFAAGAVLGPFCDGLHSQNNVLHYENPSIMLQQDIGSIHWSFETCWWVPLLFGVAGLILGVSVPLLDRILPSQQQQGQQHRQQQDFQDKGSLAAALGPSWPSVLLCISLFVTQYWLSGMLEQPTLGQTLVNTHVPMIDAILLSYALLHWAVFDRTTQGFGMAALTAVCGPAVEIFLINTLGLYHYTHPAVLGVPTWIPWVYFCGGPAVGNLGRRVWLNLEADDLAK